MDAFKGNGVLAYFKTLVFKRIIKHRLFTKLEKNIHKTRTKLMYQSYFTVV